MRHFCETLVISPAISNHQKSGLPEGCLDLVSESPRREAPATGVAPVAGSNVSTARWPVFLDDLTLTSSGFSMATMARAASRSFSQVLFRFMM